MTPALQYKRQILAIARREIASGKQAFFDFLATVDDEDVREDLLDALSDPALTLRAEQTMPMDPWSIWLMRTGRGWGKNHAASCAINELALLVYPEQQGLIVAATHKDAVDTIINGASGIIATSAPGQAPHFSPHNGRLTWPNGSTAVVRTGDNPQDIRGLSVPWAYADELIKWPSGQVSFGNISNCVREGDNPRIILTSTPLKTQRWLERIENNEGTTVTLGKSADNPFLPTSFFNRQRDNLSAKQFEEESLGLWVSENGCLWTREEIIKATAKTDVPVATFLAQCDYRQISIDPSNGKRDLAGMSLQARRGDHYWVMGDMTPESTLKQAGWIAHLKEAVSRYLQPGDTLVVETNGFQGIDETLQREFPQLRVRAVFHTGAQSGKVPRAERAQKIYQDGRVSHFAPMPRLERQMEEFYDIVDSSTESPDRA
uniref:terminase large subunit domain-containing protein n=1 Tax=uncultured Sphingomonas sp. TaxID=158754 RepID=UPI0026340B27